MIRHTEQSENTSLSLARLFATEPSADGEEGLDASRGEKFTAALLDFSSTTTEAIAPSFVGDSLLTLDPATTTSTEPDAPDGLAEIVALLQSQANAAGLGQEASSGEGGDTSEAPLDLPAHDVAPELGLGVVLPLAFAGPESVQPQTKAMSFEFRAELGSAPAKTEVEADLARSILPKPEQSAIQTTKPAQQNVERSAAIGQISERLAATTRETQAQTKPNATAVSASAVFGVAAVSEGVGTAKANPEAPRPSKSDARIQTNPRTAVSLGMDPTFQSLKDLMATATPFGEDLPDLRTAASVQVNAATAFQTWSDSAPSTPAIQTPADGTAAAADLYQPSTLTISTDGTDWEAEMIDGILSQISEDGSVIDITLTPETLGQVEVRLEMRDGLAEVSFRTETRDAARLFAQSEARLAELLNQHGLNLGNQDASARQDRRDQRQSGPSPIDETPQVSNLTSSRTGAPGPGQLDLIA